MVYDTELSFTMVLVTVVLMSVVTTGPNHLYHNLVHS